MFSCDGDKRSEHKLAVGIFAAIGEGEGQALAGGLVVKTDCQAVLTRRKRSREGQQMRIKDALAGGPNSGRISIVDRLSVTSRDLFAFGVE